MTTLIVEMITKVHFPYKIIRSSKRFNFRKENSVSQKTTAALTVL